jgi:hypothetical protein
MHPKEWDWHASQGALQPLIQSIQQAKEDAIQMCKLAIQQREGTKIDAVSLQHVGTISMQFC